MRVSPPQASPSDSPFKGRSTDLRTKGPISRSQPHREPVLIGARRSSRPDPMDQPSPQTATRLSDDPQCYWQPPRRRPPSRGVLVCRRHFRAFRQVADTSMPLPEGNHPNPCLPLRGRPLLMAQATRIGFARRSTSSITPQPLSDLPQWILDLVLLPDVPRKLRRSWRFRDG